MTRRITPRIAIMIPMNLANEPAKNATTPRIIRMIGFTDTSHEYAELSMDELVN